MYVVVRDVTDVAAGDDDDNEGEKQNANVYLAKGNVESFVFL